MEKRCGSTLEKGEMQGKFMQFCLVRDSCNATQTLYPSWFLEALSSSLSDNRSFRCCLQISHKACNVEGYTLPEELKCYSGKSQQIV